MNLLLTGPPGCGKTTVLVRIASLRPDAAGFVTEELRRGGGRRGFSVRDLAGRCGRLAEVSLPSARRVGRYGVDVGGFESVALAALAGKAVKGRLFLVDEIGKMECFSRPFVQRVSELLDSPADLIATVAMRGTGFIAQVKNRPDVELIRLDRDNRDGMAELLLAKLTTCADR